MSTIQFAAWILAFAILIVDAIWISHNKRMWYYAISTMGLALHACIFYIALFVDARNILDVHVIAKNARLFTDWSSILRLHSYITILSLELARIPAPVFFRKIKYILKGAHD